MRRRISIRGRVRPSVRRSVGPSVPCYFQTPTRRILCRVSGLVYTLFRIVKSVFSGVPPTFFGVLSGFSGVLSGDSGDFLVFDIFFVSGDFPALFLRFRRFSWVSGLVSVSGVFWRFRRFFVNLVISPERFPTQRSL